MANSALTVSDESRSRSPGLAWVGLAITFLGFCLLTPIIAYNAVIGFGICLTFRPEHAPPPAPICVRHAEWMLPGAPIMALLLCLLAAAALFVFGYRRRTALILGGLLILATPLPFVLLNALDAPISIG
jgi:hypothetical protein